MCEARNSQIRCKKASAVTSPILFQNVQPADGRNSFSAVGRDETATCSRRRGGSLSVCHTAAMSNRSSAMSVPSTIGTVDASDAVMHVTVVSASGLKNKRFALAKPKNCLPSVPQSLNPVSRSSCLISSLTSTRISPMCFCPSMSHFPADLWASKTSHS